MVGIRIVNGLPYLYLTASSYEHADAQITAEFYAKMKDAISELVIAELKGTVEPPREVLEPKTIFRPSQSINELKLPPRDAAI